MAAQPYDLFFGSTNAGLAPAFSTFVNADTGVALPQPAITDLGGGFYRFSVDWSAVAADAIRYAAGPLNGVELADTITVRPAPGAVTPAPRSQNLALYDTAGTIIARAALQLGLGQVSDPFASSDPNVLQLCEFLRQSGEDLGGEHDWSHLIRPCTFVTDGVTTSYMLPPDFHEMLDQTLWNRSAMLPGVGPLTPQQAAALQARLVNVALGIAFQIQGGLLAMPVVPPAGATATFSYVSSYWVQSENAAEPDKDAPSAATDLVLHESDLMIAALKLRFLEEKGYETAAARQRYDEKLENAIGKNTGASVISLGGGSRSGGRWGITIPEGNW